MMKWKASLISVTILLVFAAVIAGVTLRLRKQIRAEMLTQTGSILHATAHFEAARGGGTPLDLVLGMVEIDGVIAIRFYSLELEPIAFLPSRLIADPLPCTNLDVLGAGDSCTVFQERVRLASLFDDPQGELSELPVPVLRVVVDLADAEPLQGYVEFFVDGLPIAAGFQVLDQELLQQSLIAFLMGGGVILAVLLFSVHRLEASNRALVQVNRELTQHAKSAAIGAISTHLFHGLKHAVADLDSAPSSPRLQAMIQEIIDVVQEQRHHLVYSLSGDEVLRFAADKCDTLASQRGVELDLAAGPGVQLSNRQGNLLIPAIQNLLQNALEASPAGTTVQARLARNGTHFICTVHDLGPGIPADQQARLFDAGFSSKPAGSGLGLSISRQLCRFLEGDLTLAETGPGGTVFEIRVPTAPTTGP